MTAYFAPADLRMVDPRPTARPTATDESVVRELLGARLAGDDLTTALQALGLEPYERVVNTERTYAVGEVCRNGHSRIEHSFVEQHGWNCCRKCHSDRAAKKQGAAA